MSTSAGPRDPRRVLMISERADFFGGGQRSLLDLALELRAGPHPALVALPGPGPLAAALESAGVPVRYLALPRVAAARGRSMARATWALAALARREGAAVLHSDSPRAALYAGLAARLAGRAHLWHLRASIASSAFADRALLALSHHVVSVSFAAAKRSAPLRRCRAIEVVHTGIRPPAFLDRDAARAALGLPRGVVIAGVVGRVEPDKGGDDAIAALPAMRSAAPGAALAFLGAIDRDAAWPMTLRLHAAATGSPGQVHFLGERPEAARMLPAFDLILHPSRHEALPRVLIEAHYAGVPAVAYAVGGVPEIVDHERTGLLVPPRDADALAAAAAALARDPVRRRALARAGALAAEERFSIEVMGRAMNRIYAALIGDAPGAAREALG